MARIRLNLKSLSVTDKIAKGGQIVRAMTNNASFPSPNPPLPEVTTFLEDLAQAFARPISQVGSYDMGGNSG